MKNSYFRFFLVLVFFLFSASSYGSCMQVFESEPNSVEDKELVNLSAIASTFEHTALKPVPKSAIEQLVKEALLYGFRGVCVNSCRISDVIDFLKLEHKKLLSLIDREKKAGKVSIENLEKLEKVEGLLIITVVGFPLGSVSTMIKVVEAFEAHRLGADEVDMVINVGDVKDGNFDRVEQDILAVVMSVPIPVKVIIETGLLTPEEVVKVTKIAEEVGAANVKTSTGFLGKGVTPEDVKRIKSALSAGSEVTIKGSAGLKTLEDVLDVLMAGADFLGLSAGVPIAEMIKKVEKRLGTPYATVEMIKETVREIIAEENVATVEITFRYISEVLTEEADALGLSDAGVPIAEMIKKVEKRLGTPYATVEMIKETVREIIAEENVATVEITFRYISEVLTEEADALGLSDAGVPIAEMIKKIENRIEQHLGTNLATVEMIRKTAREMVDEERKSVLIPEEKLEIIEQVKSRITNLKLATNFERIAKEILKENASISNSELLDKIVKRIRDPYATASIKKIIKEIRAEEEIQVVQK